MKHFLILSFVIISFGANAQKFRQEIQDYNSVVNLRNETLAPKKNDKAFIQTTKHLYSYDLGNTTSPDDGLKYIVQTLGSYRWVCLNCHLRVELSQDSILLQYDANDILVQRDTIRLEGGGPDKFSINILGTAPYDPLNPLTGWVAPSSPIAGNTVEVKFTDGTIGNYTFDGTDWGLDFVVENKAINNLQVINEIVERGNVSLGGGQPADFTRNTYNWLGANFQDKWQSAGDANLFDIKANQTVNAANTTNSGSGAVNIGTIGANGQYKLNVGGAIWLDNGRGSVFIGQNAGQLDATSESIGVGRFALGENTGGLSTSIGAYSGYNNTGTSLAAFGYNTARLNTGAYVNAMGYLAAYNNSGTDLVAIGRGSARNNTGVNSVFIGMGAGYNNTGRLSLGIGDVALEENIGINSIGIGLGAGQSNTGESLIAVGTSTAGNNSGASSTFIGQISGYNNTGDFSVGLGYSTLLNNIGNESIAIGRESSTDNTGSFTIALGTGSLRDNVKDDVIGIGFQTAKTNNASRVIAIGYRAADDFTNPNTPLEGNNVTETILIGSHAGHNQGLAAGSEVHSHTIGIGSFALGNNNGSNVIAIGKDAGTANTQSNRVILGFNELPQFANAAAAAAAMPAAGTNGVYIYWDLSDNTIKVRP